MSSKSRSKSVKWKPSTYKVHRRRSIGGHVRMGNQQTGGDVQTLMPHENIEYRNDARNLRLDPELLSRTPQIPETVVTPPPEDEESDPTLRKLKDDPISAAYRSKRRGSIAIGEKREFRKDQAHLPALGSFNPSSSRINALLGVPKPSNVRRGSIDTQSALLSTNKSPLLNRSFSPSSQKSGSKSRLLGKLLSMGSSDKSSDNLHKLENNNSLDIPSSPSSPFNKPRRGRRASDGSVLVAFAASAGLKVAKAENQSKKGLDTLDEGSGSEKSDSSSQRSKSEHRGSVVRQSSAPNPSSRRIARAKDLIIPAFTSAGRRIRRPSVDQGPIQIKLGRSNSTKSIEATGSFPKIPPSEIYEPAMVAPRRARNRALTIANQQEARNEMDIATQRAQAAAKIPTVFRYTVPIPEDESPKKENTLKPSKIFKRRKSSNSEQHTRVWVAGTMTDWTCHELTLAPGESEYCVIIECPEGATYYKFCIKHNDDDAPEWVVDPEQEMVASTNGPSKVQANVINVKKTDKDVFAALTVDSFCVRATSNEHLEDDREKDDSLWTQVKPNFKKDTDLKEKGPPILPPHLLQVLLNKEELNIHKINSRTDRVRLPEPTSHVMLNHLYAQSIRDNMLVLASTARYKKKSVTIVYYKDLS